MATNPITKRNNFLYFLLSILVLAGIQVWGLYEFKGVTPSTSAIDAAISWMLLGATVLGLVNTLSYYHPARGRVLLSVGVPFILTWLWLKITVWLSLYFISDIGYHTFILENRFYRFSVAYLMLVGFMIFSILWYRIEEREDEQRRKEETERMAREAELFKLRQQLQPHFLFNSLNSINALIGSRPAEARGMVQHLSDFLRGTMRREDHTFIPLQEELDYLKLYLDIEQVRFGHRLKVEIGCEEHLLNWKIPPLLLQPILENAIKFGLYGTVENLVISMKCSEEGAYLIVSITNPFDEEMQAPKGTGFGLKSVKRRLFLLFARTDLLEVKTTDSIFTVNLKIPRINDKSTDN